MKSIIISAFPGMGKTYAKKHIDKYKILDLDSTDFKWLDDIKGRIPNPDFPGNYIDVIRSKGSAIDAPDIIFVSSYTEIRDALTAEKQHFYLIGPHQRLREQLIQRYRDRGNSNKFCNRLYINWDKYTDSINNETWPVIIKFNIDQFINEDFLDLIIEHSDEISKRTEEAIKKNNISDLKADDIFWSPFSKLHKFSDKDDIYLYAYKELLDWDLMCKFNKVPDKIITAPIYEKYLNWRYLENNIKKYNPKTRKYISTKVDTL